MFARGVHVRSWEYTRPRGQIPFCHFKRRIEHPRNLLTKICTTHDAFTQDASWHRAHWPTVPGWGSPGCSPWSGAGLVDHHEELLGTEIRRLEPGVEVEPPFHVPLPFSRSQSCKVPLVPTVTARPSGRDSKFQTRGHPHLDVLSPVGSGSGNNLPMIEIEESRTQMDPIQTFYPHERCDGSASVMQNIPEQHPALEEAPDARFDPGFEVRSSLCNGLAVVRSAGVLEFQPSRG